MCVRGDGVVRPNPAKARDRPDSLNCGGGTSGPTRKAPVRLHLASQGEVPEERALGDGYSNLGFGRRKLREAGDVESMKGFSRDKPGIIAGGRGYGWMLSKHVCANLSYRRAK